MPLPRVQDVKSVKTFYDLRSISEAEMTTEIGVVANPSVVSLGATLLAALVLFVITAVSGKGKK
jgi:hypothetical protein